MPRLLHRAQIRPIRFHTPQPFLNLRPLLALRNQPELQDELDRESHHRVSGRHGAANEVAPAVGREVGVQVVEIVAGVSGESGVVGGGGGGGGAADVEGDEAVLGAGEGVLVGVRMGMWRDTYEEEGGLGGVNVGEDFDALFLVGGDELVKGIVSLAEVSAFSLATTLPTAPIPGSVPNIEDPA